MACHSGSTSIATSQGQSGGTEKTERRDPVIKRNVHLTPTPLPSTHFLPPARLDHPKVSHFPNNAIGRGPSVSLWRAFHVPRPHMATVEVMRPQVK